MSKIGFKLEKPEAGITTCLWEIEAADQQEALGKFISHLRELNIQFTHPPTPLSDTANPAVIGQEFMKRICQVTDPIALVVTLHLFVEHWLDRILAKFLPRLNSSRYSFYQKLEIAYSADKLTQNLFENISKLNKLRNNIAHDPDFDLTKMDLSYVDCPANFELSHYKPSYDANAKQHHILNVLKGVMQQTYGNLHNHCFNVLGFNTAKTTQE